MRYLLSIILCLWASCAWAWSPAINAVVASGNTTSSPSATLLGSWSLSAAGGDGAQLYNSVTSTWEGGGANTVDFTNDYLEANATTDRAWIPGSYFQKPAGADGITIKFEYQVSALDANLYSFNYPYTTGVFDGFNHKHYGSSGISSVSWKTNNLAATYNYSNADLALNTWHTVYYQIDMVSKTLRVWVNGTEKTGGVQTTWTNIGDPLALDSGVGVGYITSGTNVVRVRNMSVYAGFVTP